MKKLNCLLAFLVLLGLSACSEKGLDNFHEDESGVETVAHEMIELGKKLNDPYSVNRPSARQSHTTRTAFLR